MAETTVNNGVNVEALLAAREALKSAPEAAKFKWRGSCKWQNGTHSETKIEVSTGSGRNRSTGPRSRSTPTIRRSLPPRITASPR